MYIYMYMYISVSIFYIYILYSIDPYMTLRPSSDAKQLKRSSEDGAKYWAAVKELKSNRKPYVPFKGLL